MVKREELPIFRHREEIIATVRGNLVTVVEGETGSGKSTQIPQYMLDGGLGLEGIVVCTQPRRKAATSGCIRIRDERRLGRSDKQVGYKIRNKSEWISGATRMIVETEGVLLRQLFNDPYLNNYTVVILDEVHERSVEMDLLLLFMRSLVLPLRRARNHNPLRLIVMSATLSVDTFKTHFEEFSPATIRVKGRCQALVMRELTDAVLPIDMVLAILTRDPNVKHGILVFLPGQADVEGLVAGLKRQRVNGQPLPIYPLPAYAALPWKELNDIDAPVPSGLRKIVVATNIAETSLTLDGIKYVVDRGLTKEMHFNPHTRASALITTHESTAQMLQRAGRAGRTTDGVYFPTFGPDDLSKIEKKPRGKAAIEITDATGWILQVKAIRYDPPVNLLGLPFISPPPVELMRHGIKMLVLLGAVEKSSPFNITTIGNRMSRAIIHAIDMVECGRAKSELVDDILALAALLPANELPRVFFEPRLDKNGVELTKEERAAERLKWRFSVTQGDMYSYLDAWDFYQTLPKENQKRQQYECTKEKNRINPRTMRTADENYAHFKQILYQQYRITPIRRLGRISADESAGHRLAILEALSVGFCANIAYRRGWNYHQLVGDPASAPGKAQALPPLHTAADSSTSYDDPGTGHPEFILYAYLMEDPDGCVYMHECIKFTRDAEFTIPGLHLQVHADGRKELLY